MTGYKSLLSNLKVANEGDVSFGNNSTGKIIGTGDVCANKVKFEGVKLVDNLKFNLLSVSQMCDKGYGCYFTKTNCKVIEPNLQAHISNLISNHAILNAKRNGNVYMLDLSHTQPTPNATCFLTRASNQETNLWHRRLGHVNLKTMNNLAKKGLVRGLPQKEFTCDEHCVACLKGKQHKSSYKSIDEPQTKACLEMLHLDLFGPVRIMSLAKKRYCLVIVDDYSRFAWTYFLHSKDETPEIVKEFITQAEKQHGIPVKVLRSDNGTEFRNQNLDSFCVSKGIIRQFSVPRTPQQNGVVERKNRTLIEAARSMIADSGLPLSFWAEAVSTACYVQNRVLVNKRHDKTAYEILFHIKPLISFFKTFGCPCFILNLKESISKFAAKIDTGYFLGYSSTAKAYRVFNSKSMTIEETLDVKFNENSSLKIPANPAELFDLDVLMIKQNSENLHGLNESSAKTGDCRYEISPAVVQTTGNFHHTDENAGN